MLTQRRGSMLLVVAAVVLGWAECLAGGIVPASLRPLASNLVVPQRRVFAVSTRQPVQITGVRAEVAILERAATTTLEIALLNPSDARQEAELLVPVPEGAAVRGFAYQGAAKEPTAQVLPRDEARKTYESIVSALRDPALLEFADSCLVRSSVFPIEARDKQLVQLTYDGLLAAEANRVDYLLPRTEVVDYSIPWQVRVTIKSRAPISTVYSPSHRLATRRVSPNEVVAEIASESQQDPGAFRLSYLAERDGVTASMFAYPDPKVGGGYFLLLAGLPAKPPDNKAARPIKREVTMVFDRSGSMSGEKLEQVREAANQVLAGLDEGEAFNIIVYNDQVHYFAESPVMKTSDMVRRAREYLAGVTARGGTNIHDALVAALHQRTTSGFLPMVLFLTDGLPTVGQTSEVAIREAVLKGNPQNRRIFTFGVGTDVNTPLLDRIAFETRATSTYVLPKEDVEVKVARVFQRLAGPVLADAILEVVGPDKRPAPGRVRDVIPARLPDLFEGDQLVVLGQYVGDQPLTFSLRGNYLGQRRAFQFRFEPAQATTRNAFVPRLWASRKIAVLFDAIRDLGADIGAKRVYTKSKNPKANELVLAISELAGLSARESEAKLKELVAEVIRISTEFGILTEYTAFLAREGTDLTRRRENLAQAEANYRDRAMNTRTGLGAVSQNFNYVRSLDTDGEPLNYRNEYYDENLNRVSITTVQQINDRAFFRRGGQWVDSQVVADTAKGLKPDLTVAFGSTEYWKLIDRLARENRQGIVALSGELLLRLDGRNVLITTPGATPPRK